MIDTVLKSEQWVQPGRKQLRPMMWTCSIGAGMGARGKIAHGERGPVNVRGNTDPSLSRPMMGSLSPDPLVLGACKPLFRVYSLFPQFPTIISQRSLQTEVQGGKHVPVSYTHLTLPT